MSILSEKTEQKAKDVLAQCLSLFSELTNLQMTAEDAFEARKAENLLRFIILDNLYMEKRIIIDDVSIAKDEMYVLVLWPEVQDLMEYEWFCPECLLYQAFEDQEHVDSAYFVPVNRITQINQPG